MKLSGNTILITGGSSGIGLELAKKLEALGNQILITGRDAKKLEAAKKLLPKVRTYQSDVSDTAAIEALYTKVTSDFPDLNVLINNAGIMRTINVHDESGDLEDITREIEINLNGPIRMVKRFLPHLKKEAHCGHYECVVGSGVCTASCLACLLRDESSFAFFHDVAACAVEENQRKSF